MLNILREILTRADDGTEVVLVECLVETDTTMQQSLEREVHSERYFRERDGGMRALKARPIEPGVFKRSDGVILREI